MTAEEATRVLNQAPFSKIVPACKAGRAWVIESAAIPAYRLIQRAPVANAPARALGRKGVLS